MAPPASRSRGVGVYVALGLLALVLVLLLRFPASWAMRFLPAGVVCAEPSGSVWSGACTGLSWQSTALGDAVWDVRPAALLTGHLAGTLTLSHPKNALSTGFSVSFGGNVELDDVRARLPLDNSLFRQFPANLRGEARIQLSELRMEDGRVAAIRGIVEARDLVQLAAMATPLGSYEVRFDSPPLDDGTIAGIVRDLGGPFAFDGSLKLTPQPGYELNGRVAPRAGAPEAIVQQLAFFGSPESDGRRPLSVSGTF